MLGDPAVGKTSLVRRYVYDEFSDDYITTFGTKPVKKVVDLEEHTVDLIIWDIAGHITESLFSRYFSGASGAVIVCDMTRKKTLDSVEKWYSRVVNNEGEIPVKLLLNKYDLDEWDYDRNEVDYPKMNPSVTSAKTGNNVEESFKSLAKDIIS